MSDMQSIIASLIAAIREKRITIDVAEAAVRMLDGVPDYSHMDAIKALLKAPSEPEEQPEDYLAVKTFASNEFHIGDEISVCSGLRGVYVGRSCIGGGYCLLVDRGKIYDYADTSAWTRTGRNFPAIPAIMEELKKA